MQKAFKQIITVTLILTASYGCNQKAYQSRKITTIRQIHIEKYTTDSIIKRKVNEQIFTKPSKIKKNE